MTTITGNSVPCAVVALGGNALWRPGEWNTVADQFRHTRESLMGIIDILRNGYHLVITHGNGPQVGAALRRVEITHSELPDVPLGVLVADTQGSMGYMIEQSLQNLLAKEKIKRRVVSIITQVLVEQNDPALANPTKFIGQIFTREQAEKFISEEGWIMKPYKGEDQWRRVVGSPQPISIINSEIIKEMVNQGIIVIAAGGGGIPVYQDEKLGLEGIDAVVDKDLAAAILARDIDADELLIFTNVDTVKTDFGKDTERSILFMTSSEAQIFLKQGQFPPGNMGPKIEAAIKFMQSGVKSPAKRVIICDLPSIKDALKGKAGTIIA